MPKCVEWILMPLDLCAKAVFRSLPWVQHGFGTRHPAENQEDLATLKQIHSNLVLMAEFPGLCGEGDALVTNHPGVAISIRTADCYPILLADGRHRAVAGVHAGWRGSVTQIVDRTLERMNAEFG